MSGHVRTRRPHARRSGGSGGHGRRSQPHDGLLALQQAAGNKAVARAIQREKGDDGSSRRRAGPRAVSAPIQATLVVAGGRLGAPLHLRLDINRDQLRVLLPSVSFGERAIPGTPVRLQGNQAHRERFRLVSPRLKLGLADGRLRGSATLEIPSGHPFVDPTPVKIDVSTKESLPSTLVPRRHGAGIGPGPVTASASVLGGVLKADVDAVVGVRISRVLAVIEKHLGDHVGTALTAASPVVVAIRDALGAVATGNTTIEDAAAKIWQTVKTQAGGAEASVLRRQLIQTLRELKQEVTRPGFRASGTAKAFGYVPLAWGAAGAPTTRQTSRPLHGGTPIPMWYFLGGLTIVPAGGRYSTPRPAVGAAGASFGERSGVSGSVAAVPGLDPDAISSGKPVAQWFPVDLQLQARAVTRVSDGLDLGLKIEAVVPSSAMFGKGQGETSFDDLRTAITSPAAMATPQGAYILGSITGRFDLP